MFFSRIAANLLAKRHTLTSQTQSASTLPVTHMSTAAAATYPIIGIQDGRGPNGAVPVRYEILRFANPNVNVHAKEQLNLFLQALERFHATPHEELLSWFKIAGESAVVIER